MVREPRLETRVVVVTDADGERGAGLARAMVKLGAAVVVVGSDTDALATLAAELGSTGARVAVLVDDVATEAGRAALVEMVNELFPAGRE
jgi:NAD(P)-dependent dehydrogenase (short-subunit alcohol dehydrogenase family)